MPVFWQGKTGKEVADCEKKRSKREPFSTEKVKRLVGKRGWGRYFKFRWK